MADDRCHKGTRGGDEFENDLSRQEGSKVNVLKVPGWATLVAMAALPLEAAYAQTAVPEPASVLANRIQQVAFCADEGCVEEEACCEPEPSCDSCDGCAPSCCGGCDLGCGCEKVNRWCCCGKLEDPWTLPKGPVAQCMGLDYGGWMSAGMFGNAHGASTNGNNAAFNDLTGFNVHQLWFYGEKAVDTSKYGVGWGGRVDFLYGVDAPDTTAFGDGGWDTSWTASGDYGWAMPQLYLELGVGDLRVKAGHFYTIIGYEVVQAPDNFFYSHALTMYYAEPFTHTGFLAQYPLCDEKITLYGGWTAGWDTGWGNNFGASTFLGGVSLAIGDSASLTWANTFGYLGYDTVADEEIGNVYMNSIVFSWDMTEKLSYVLQHDYGTNYGAVIDDNAWYGINQYLTYAWTDCLASGARIEWFSDPDGARIGPAGDWVELTLGLNVRPHANMIIRPEIRWDWYTGDAAPPDRPFNDGNSNSQFGGGFDFIVTW